MTNIDSGAMNRSLVHSELTIFSFLRPHIHYLWFQESTLCLFWPDYSGASLRYDCTKKCPTILYGDNLWLKPLSATGANDNLTIWNYMFDNKINEWNMLCTLRLNWVRKTSWRKYDAIKQKINSTDITDISDLNNALNWLIWKGTERR